MLKPCTQRLSKSHNQIIESDFQNCDFEVFDQFFKIDCPNIKRRKACYLYGCTTSGTSSEKTKLVLVPEKSLRDNLDFINNRVKPCGKVYPVLGSDQKLINNDYFYRTIYFLLSFFLALLIAKRPPVL